MLSELYIKNIATVKELCVSFDRPFNVMTGNTGAGKSVIIGCIRCLCVDKPSHAVRTGESSAVVSAIFTDLNENEIKRLSDAGVDVPDGDALLIQRDMTKTADGGDRSVFRVNCRTVPAGMCRQIMSFLVAVHGQHATQALLNEKQHGVLIDAFAGDSKEREEYSSAFSAVNDAKKRLESHLAALRDASRMEEIYRFRVKDIENVAPKPDEEEKLTEQKKRLSSIEKLEKIGTLVERALLNNERGVSASDMIGRAADAVEKLDGTVGRAAELAEKLREYQYEITDIGEYIVKECSVDVDNPSVLLDRIESRLDAIAKLRKKYGGTLESVFEAYNEAKTALSEAGEGEEKTDRLKNELADAEAALKTAAGKLTAARKKAAAEIERRVSGELGFLDMEKVRFRVEITAAEYSQTGADGIRFLISTNPGEPPMPLSKIASGGELSRIMLAMKCVFAENEQTTTLVYDEIDTGISGRTSHKIGQKLKQSASSGRVICVTHSPQIAALADRHILIEKEEKDGRAVTSAAPIEGEDRVREIARIIGGAKITEKTVAAAADMLNQAKETGK